MFNFFSALVFSLPLRVLGPLGKFKSQFSIVSALRGLYITENESCQFYYRWSTAPLIKTRLHIPLHLAARTKQPCLISLLSEPPPPIFSFNPCLSPQLSIKCRRRCAPLPVMKRPGRTSPQQARGSLLAAGAEIKSAWRFTSSRLPCQYPSPVQSAVILKCLSPSPSKTSFHITYI